MSDLIFNEVWFSERDCRRLAELVEMVADVPGRIVEIGSWEGRSTVVLANAAWPRQVEAVDTWEGDPSDVTAQLSLERDVHAAWVHNVARGTQGNVVEFWMDWTKHREQDDSPIALIFIDAAHTYEQVSAQIDAYLPLMSEGGVVCGDDLPIWDVYRAVSERFHEVTLCERMWWVKP